MPNMLNKYLKDVGLKGRQIISLAEVATCLGPVLLATVTEILHVLLFQITGLILEQIRGLFEGSDEQF
jgi:hypothetical protein